MKLVRSLLATVALACALAINVYAGDQQTPAFCSTCPPPPPATSTTDSDKTDTTSDVDQSNNVLASEGSDYFFDALMALLSVY